MTALAMMIFATLGMLAALHIYWARGGLWPASSTQELARTVIGSKDGGMPARALTGVVAILIICAGALPLVHMSALLPRGLTLTALWVLASVFLVRGAISYALPGLAAGMSEPFRSLNARYYSPLCLLLGAGFLATAHYS